MDSTWPCQPPKSNVPLRRKPCRSYQATSGGAPAQQSTRSSEPFSSKEPRVAQAAEWAAGGGLRIATLDGARAGALVLGARPPWVAPADVPERYIEALVTSHAFAGRDVGGELVRRAIAEASAAGAALLRVDCWADAPELVAWYERQGFRRSGTFELEGWHGQVLSMPVQPAVPEPLAAASATA
jgi:ribosomal protein S18 acetylase RimI-like enzyme